jgi:hypothetical protein
VSATGLGRREFLTLGFVRPTRRSPEASKPGRWRLPDVTLRTPGGERVRLYEDLVRDHVVVIHLPHSGWDEHPRVMRNLRRVHELLGVRFGTLGRVLSVSIDPSADGDPGVQPREGDERDGWLTLRGEPAVIEAIGLTIGAHDSRSERDIDPSRSAGIVALGSDRTDRWAALPALLDPAQIVARVERLDGR